MTLSGHLTICVGRDCGNVFLLETQLLLDGQFCKPYPVAHVKNHGWTVAHLTICVGRDCGNGCGCGHGSEHCCRSP